MKKFNDGNPGRPRLVPEEEDKELVRELARKGLSQQHIADALGVGIAWFKKRCADPESDLHKPFHAGRAERAEQALDKYWEIIENSADDAVRERALRKVLNWIGYSKPDEGVKASVDMEGGSVEIEVIDSRDYSEE